MNKVCTKCKIEFSLTEFSPKKINKDGLNSWCKSCNAKATLIYYYNNKEKCDNRSKEKATKLNTRFSNSKSSAKRRGLDFSFKLEEYSDLIKLPCYYCDNLLGKQSVIGSGLDRIDSSKGYVQGNCVSCCKLCNQIKMNILTLEETKLVIGAILKKRGLYKIIEAEFD